MGAKVLMIGKNNPAVNAIQTLVALKTDNDFQIVLFQNTPAAFHERPELGDKLTRDLQDALQNNTFNRWELNWAEALFKMFIIDMKSILTST